MAREAGQPEENIDVEFYNESGYFDNSRSDYKKLMSSPLQLYRIKKLIELHRPSMEEKVLDMGSAWGTVAFAFAPLCKEIVGVDFSSKAVEISNKSLASSGLDNVTFVCAPAEDTGLESNYFDSIICADLLEHIYPKQSELVLEEAYRVLNKGGVFVLWTPHRGHIFEVMKNRNLILKRDVSHVDYKSMDWLLKHLEECGFRIKRSGYFKSHVPVFNFLEQVLQPFTPLMRRRIGIVAVKE